MFGDGEAAMKIEGTWFLEIADNYFGEAAGNENEWDWVPMPSVTGDAIFDLGIGRPTRSTPTPRIPTRPQSSSTTTSRPRPRPGCWSNCGIAPAPVDLEGQDLTGVNPGLAAILEAMNEASAANNYGYTTWTFWPPKSETYLRGDREGLGR